MTTKADRQGGEKRAARRGTGRPARPIPWIGLLLVGLSIPAACELTSDKGSTTGLAVVKVVVSPATATLDSGSTQAFMAYGVTAAGGHLAGQFTWTASRGHINSAGLYVADGATGAVTITASSSAWSLSAHATVTVERAAPVVGVTVVPDTATVDSGGTQAFTAYGVTGGSAHVSGQFTWSASGGHIGSSGLYTADGPNGSITVTATSAAWSLSGHATVTVVGSPPPPPPGTLFRENFEDNNFASRGWYDNTAMTTTTAQHVTGSTRALEVHYLQGAVLPTWGGAARHLFTPSNSVYLSYWVKYSTNWVGSGKPYHPHEFLFLTTDDEQYAGPSFTHLTAYVEQNYQNGGIPLLELQDGSNIDQSKIGVDLTAITEDRAANGCNGLLDALVSDCYLNSPGVYNNEKKLLGPYPVFLPDSGPGYKGDWHFVEAYFQLNSILLGKGIPDGVIRYWFDGQSVMDQEHVLMRTGAHPTMQFNQFLIGPYIGDGSPVDQTMWVDDLTVATARPASPAPQRTR